MFLGKTYQEFAPGLVNDSIVGRARPGEHARRRHEPARLQHVHARHSGRATGRVRSSSRCPENRATTDMVTALNDVLIRHPGDNEVRLRLVRGDTARVFETPVPRSR